MLRALLLLLAIFSAGCATSRPTPPCPFVLHVAPSTTLVSLPVAEARAATVKAAQSVTTATAANFRAADLAKAIAEKGSAPTAPEALALEQAIDLTGAELFHASASLQATSEQLTVAEGKISELDARLTTQTAEFNATDQKRAEAEARAFDLDVQRRALVIERDKYKHALWWSKFKIWGGFLGAIGILVAAFAFKVVGFGTRAAAVAGRIAL